ncbi:MAG: hypothetical protein M1828_004952 [Chrysothrix sp. TS-e1954]|nr:MAG: hypothetical protein M1828_004952 [Chrysothrix sp. TS-e1954]
MPARKNTSQLVVAPAQATYSDQAVSSSSRSKAIEFTSQQVLLIGFVCCLLFFYVTSPHSTFDCHPIPVSVCLTLCAAVLMLVINEIVKSTPWQTIECDPSLERNRQYFRHRERLAENRFHTNMYDDYQAMIAMDAHSKQIDQKRT